MVKACKSEHLYKTSSFCCNIHSLLSFFPLLTNPMMVLKLLCFHLFRHTITNTSSSGSGAPEKRFCAHKSAKRIKTLAFTMWHLGIFLFLHQGAKPKSTENGGLHTACMRTNESGPMRTQTQEYEMYLYSIYYMYVCVSVLV